MSTFVKNIRQHSFEIPNCEEFIEIAKRYTTVKNYVYSRFLGINSLDLLKSYKKEIRDKWTDKASGIKNGGFANQWKLPARYWKLALDEAITNIKSEWSNTKNRIRVAVRNNFNLAEEERQFIYYVLKANPIGKSFRLELPIDLTTTLIYEPNIAVVSSAVEKVK